MTDDPWALCHLDDSFDSSVLGIKGAQLQWFEDRDSLIAFLLEDFIDLLADAGELDEDEVASARERFTLLVEQIRDDRGLVDALNDLASGLPVAVAWLAAHGHAVRRVSSGRANLEDVFLALTGRQLRD